MRDGLRAFTGLLHFRQAERNALPLQFLQVRFNTV